VFCISLCREEAEQENREFHVCLERVAKLQKTFSAREAHRKINIDNLYAKKKFLDLRFASVVV